MRLNHFSICAASLMAGLALTVACGDDDKDSNPSSTFDGHLSGTIKTESGAALNGEVNSVEVSYNDGNSSQTYTVTANGAFDFTLPTPAASDLRPLAEGMPGGVSLTPADVKCVTFNELNVFKDGDYVGYVSRSKITTASYVLLMYFYVDKAAVVTGSFTEGGENITLNMNLAAGWNIAVMKSGISGDKYSASITTGNVPTDIQWTLNGGYDTVDGYAPQPAKTGFGLFGK
jgi:hypothetical protein